MEETQERKVFIFPHDFFIEPNFVSRLKDELAVIRQRIRLEEKEQVKKYINAFYFACIDTIKDENIRLEIHLSFLELLNTYAHQYDSEQTYKNIIDKFEQPDFKHKVFAKFSVRAKIVYAETLFMYYNLIKFEEPLFSKEKTELLIKAKSYLWKIYIQHIERKKVLDEQHLSHCLTLLSGSLTELSRWFEPLYYLNIAKAHLPQNPNIEYLRAFLLEAIKLKTGLSFNGLLILKIIDSCIEVIKFPHIRKEQKDQLIELERLCRKFLFEKKMPIKKLREHKLKSKQFYNSLNPFKKFCLDNQLFLNEHSFFCNCTKSTRDNIRIQTKFKTKNEEWTEQFEGLIDILVSDFIVARHNYYYSQEDVLAPSLRINTIKRPNAKEGVNNALLKNAFKTFYSLLDQIAFGILKVFDIDYKSKLKELYPETSLKTNVYFLNLWDFNFFDDEHFANNFYLTSLYSIAQDLNKSDYAALTEFKALRNAMEHKIFRIVPSIDTNSIRNKDEMVCTKEELLEKAKILMMLTKSAIYSFVYLIRKEAKYREKGNND